MDCVCQCGRQVPVEINSDAVMLMLELVEFDRFRALLRSSDARNGVGLDLSNTDSFIGDGATLYRHALDSMHGESSWSRHDHKAAGRWLKFSRRTRRKLHRDTDGFVRKDKLPPLMTPDLEYLDREHPERIYSSRIGADGRLVHAGAPATTPGPELTPAAAMPSSSPEPSARADEGLAAEVPPRPAKIAACFTSDPDTLYAEAVVIVRERMADGSKRFTNYCLSFEEEDRTAVFIDGDLSSLIADTQQFDDRREAVAEAKDWIDERPQKVEFEGLPGTYQGAMWSYLLGIELEATPGWFGWVLPAGKGLAVIRDFPPRLEPTEITPEPGTVSWSPIPTDAAQAMQREILPPQR